jgi:hypothetical protein
MLLNICNEHGCIRNDKPFCTTHSHFRESFFLFYKTMLSQQYRMHGLLAPNGRVILGDELIGSQALGGRAIVQAVSRRLPTAATRVQAQVKSRKMAGFIVVLWFPLPILIPPTAPHSSIIRGWYNRPVSGRCNKWTQSHLTPRNKLGPWRL